MYPEACQEAGSSPSPRNKERAVVERDLDWLYGE